MKPVQLTLHPSSALAGAFLLALCLVTLGAFTPQGSSSARDVSATEIVDRSPQDYVRHVGTADLTVPSDKYLIITGVGSTEVGGNTLDWPALMINGSVALFIPNSGGSAGVGSFGTCPEGLIAPPNSNVTTTKSWGTFIGYLVDA